MTGIQHGLKFGNFYDGDILYTFEGSNKIINAEITSWTIKDGEEPFTVYTISANNDGKIIIKNVSTWGYLYPGKAKVKITFEDGTTDTDEFFVYAHTACLAEGTEITLADRTTKKIEDITYEDELLVWDFDNGSFATAKLWKEKACGDEGPRGRGTTVVNRIGNNECSAVW